MESSKAKNYLFIKLIAFIFVTSVIGLLVWSFVRPEIKSMKFVSMQFESNFCYTTITVECNKSCKIEAEEFSLNSGNLPKSAKYFKIDNILSDNPLILENGETRTITVVFKLGDIQVDRPIKLAFRGKLIT